MALPGDSLMAYADTDQAWREYQPAPHQSITIYALKENKRPIGYAPWPTEKPKRKRAPRKPKEEKGNAG